MDESSTDENSINSDNFDVYNEESELSNIDENDDEDQDFNVTSISSSSSYQGSASICNTDFDESQSTEDGIQQIEILEENNNDPNNNMEIEGEILDNNHHNVPIIEELPVSPKPGCSRDFDLVESSQTNETLIHKQVTEIQEFFRNISYIKIYNLIKKNENFKKELFQLFEETTLKRNGNEDICDIENKKVTTQITPVATIMEEKNGNNNTPEELLDGVTEMKKSGHRLTPPQTNQERKHAHIKNPTPISLDSSDDEAVLVSDINPKESTIQTKRDNQGHQNKLKAKVPTKETKMPQRGQIYRTTLTNGHSKLVKAPFTVSAIRTAPATIVRESQANNNQIQSTSTTRITGIPLTSTTRITGIPSNFYVTSTSGSSRPPSATAKVTTVSGEMTVQMKHNLADGEPVPKIKIVTQGKTSRVIPATSSEPPHQHRSIANDEPNKAPGKTQHERWNPIFHQYDQVKYQDNHRALNRALNEAKLENDLILTLREEADREIAETLSLKYKNDRKMRAFDLPKLQPVAINVDALPDLPPRPEIVNVDEAQPQVPGKVKEVYCQEIYTKLRAMFPNIKKDYIKNITPADWAPNVGHDVQFGQIVDRLLASEAQWELEIPDDLPGDLVGAVGGVSAPSSRTIDETYEQLLELFPEADPTYLRTHAERVYNKEQAFQEFIEQTFKKHDYPTRDQYLSQMRSTEERLSYTQNFTVQGFLEKFPDPFKHFLDKTRKYQYDLLVFEFLKCHFNRIRVNTISRIYKDSGYNMSIAALKLAEIGSEMASTRKGTDMPPKDIKLLQEMAFVRHQKEIKDYIAKMEEAEKLEFEELKKSNGLLECQCCFDNECMPSKCSTCDNGHIFCNSCIVNGTDSRLGESETHVPCFVDCGSEFSLATLQKILKPTKFSILVKKRQAAEVAAAGLEGLVACPFCHFASIPPEGDKVFKCLNPECMKESCIQCKEPNHVPLRCNEVGKADKARKYIEEEMTKALARNCYKCKKAYFKEEGCNKIRCPCGAIMCYLCNEKIQDYSHFRGQGSDDMSKCPLYSDNARLNAENVRRVADEARRELLRQDPALNIDTERLLPNVPPPSTGPHQQILQAPLRLPIPNMHEVVRQLNQAAQEVRYLQNRRHHH